jgi:RimJ/RimL family protein N-acetyltransferase
VDYHPFEGRLVRLRAREPEDEPLFHRWINDPEVTEHLAARYPFSHPQERDFLARTDGSSFSGAHFSIEALADGRLIGNAALRLDSPENRAATFGITIGEKEYWSRGYGTDATRVVCRFGFEMMNLHRIELQVYADNPRAVGAYEKAGFQQEGRLRDGDYRFGRYRDVLVMGLLEGELRME